MRSIDSILSDSPMGELIAASKDAAAQLAHAANLMARLADHQRLRASLARREKLYVPNNTVCTLPPTDRNTFRVHTLFATVVPAAGAVTIQLGNDFLGPIANPASGVIFLHSLDFQLGGGDLRQLTTQAAGPIFFALFGEQVGDALSVS